MSGKNTQTPRKLNQTMVPIISSSTCEFDGTTVLCRVCGDKASGFHYGVHSCEGCKGFFRRSIQQKIQYRPCTKNQQCSILRINRNRCQYCRLKKCIAVGMSRDAVRFGRVPKREKAKILAAMQSVNARSQERALAAELEDESRLIATIVTAHEQTCDYTQEKVAPLLQRAIEEPVYTQCPPTLACPLNPNPQVAALNGNQRILEDFSERFSPAIKGVVEFAKRIPGFSLLSQDDQVTLLKAGVFEVLLVRLACMFDSQRNIMLCLNGQVLKRESLHNSSNARFLMDSMFDFTERLNMLRLHDGELGLFCAVVIIAADRPGIRNVELVEKMQNKLMQGLQNVVAQNHPEFPSLFQELMKKIPDLRTLNTLHSEKLLAFKMEPRNNPDHPHHHQHRHQQTVTTSTIKSYMTPHQQQHQWPAEYGPDDSSKGSWEERERSSPGQRSSSAGSEWSESAKETDSYGSPISVEYGGNEDGGIKSPTLSKNGDNESVCSREVAHITELHHHHMIPPQMMQQQHRRRGHSEGGSSSGDEGSITDSPSRCPFKIRKLDSPLDSGIESGKESGPGSNGPHSTSTSMCGSPHSLVDEKVKDVEMYGGSPRRVVDPSEDMPVLKRALQAPPLINTNLLMDEAYKPHKKFRALRKDPDVQSSTRSAAMSPVSAANSEATPAPTAAASHTTLASSHSMLVKSLTQGPRMTEQQLKRTDIIHDIIMRGEQRGEQRRPDNGAPIYPTYGAPTATKLTTATATTTNYYIPQQVVPQQYHHNGMTHGNNGINGAIANGITNGVTNGGTWPFVTPANAGLTVQVRPAATFVPNNNNNSQLQQRLQPPTTTSPQPQQQQLPRMYYDPRGSSTSPISSPANPSSPFNPGYNSKMMSPKPSSSPELRVILPTPSSATTESQQPLNLSKKVASPPSSPIPHKVKMEG